LTGLDWRVRTAAAAIESKLKSHCRVFLSLTGLDRTGSDSARLWSVRIPTALSWVVCWNSVIKSELCLGVAGITLWRRMGRGTTPCIPKFVTWRRVVSLTLHLL